MAVYSTVRLNQRVGTVNATTELPSVLDLGTVQIDGNSDLAWGFNFGMQVDVDDEIFLGVNFRSQVIAKFEGDADFQFVGTGEDDIRDSDRRSLGKWPTHLSL